MSNSNNKQQFIQLFSKELDNAKIQYKLCDDDADLDIVKQAMFRQTQNYDVIIVGQDIDLLVLLTHYTANVQENIYFFKTKIGDRKIRYILKKVSNLQN